MSEPPFPPGAGLSLEQKLRYGAEAAVFFAFSGQVVWELVPVMAAASVVGGVAGGRLVQVIDAGATWHFRERQGVDVHFGFGLNSAAPNHFFGIGYSFRLDGLF